MNRKRFTLLLAAAALGSLLAGAGVRAQCPAAPFAAGLKAPAKIIFSSKGNLLVAEGGEGPNTGRISILDPVSGDRRTLLDGLPSGFAPPGGEPIGPTGLFMRGRNLYVTIGEGDETLRGPVQGTNVPNPNPSSPILSSVLAVHFSANFEETTEGLALTLADHLALKGGSTLTLDGGGGGKMTVRLVADFPDYVPAPRPTVPDAVRPSNPFGLVALEEQLYVVDAGMNIVRRIDLETGDTSTLTTFANLPNTRGFGPPTVEAVPDSIRLFGEGLLVTLLSGAPFPPGQAQVRTVDPATGASAPFITGLTTAIDVLPLKAGGGASQFLTLEHSADLVARLPGRLKLHASPGATPNVIADCLQRPTSMALAKKTGDLFITEIFAGRVVRIAAAQFFVRQHYLDFLAREPDTEGWQFWAGQITQCGEDEHCAERKRVDVSRAFFYSGEFITGNPLLADYLRGTPAYNEAFVEQCYLRYLQRPPDADGFQFWVGKLNGRIPYAGDGDYNEMILAFLRSTEYQARAGLFPREQ
jgi:hypothetical protein